MINQNPRKIKLSDYVLQFLEKQGIRHVFLMTGAALANLVDSFRNVPGIDYVCVQHEQAGAMAAEAYSRVTGNLGAVAATSGPGATNLITGICCAYFDSIPLICLTGQVNTYESKGNRQVRQVGFQETDIVSIVKPVTKYAKLVADPKQIKFELEKAVYLAKSGRPGPVLLDLPMDVQRAEIEVDSLAGFKPAAEIKPDISQKINQVLSLIKNAKRPMVLLGAGVKLAKAQKEAKEFIEKLNLPFTLSWGGIDIIGHDHPLFAGTFGVSASRFGNFAVQNSDLLLAVGSRLDTRQTGGRPETFAREAKKIIIDIDPAEIHKNRGLTADIAIEADAKHFFQAINQRLENFEKTEIDGWVKKIRAWKEKYPICLPEYKDQKEKVNIYYFMDVLSDLAKNDDIIITDTGSNLTWTLQGFKVKDGQKLFSAFGNSPMGYSFPASIGASLALNKKPIICVIGDGGMQINIQDLMTVAYHKLPIKIFVIENEAYGLIKQFQDVWFESRYEATCPEKGVGMPDFVKVARAYGLEATVIENHEGLREKIRNILVFPGPILVSVKVRGDEKVVPKLEFGKPIEDASPLLGREEFKQNMIIKPLDNQ